MRHALLDSRGAALLCTLMLLSCGGGGGGDPPQHTAILADPDWDGAAFSDGHVSFDPRADTNATGDLEGSYGAGYEIRQIYAFSLGSPPAGIRVTRAELRLSQVRVEGDPYGKNGNVVVDHVSYVGEAGSATFDGQSLQRDIGTLSTSPSLGLRTLDVTDVVRNDLSVDRAWCQFRLRFYTPIVHPILDHESDYVIFKTAESTFPGDPPTLVIYYE